MNQETMQTRTPGTLDANGETERAPRQTYRPNLDLFESDAELTLRVDLPGVDPANIDIQFEKDTLSLSAQTEDRPREGRALLTEYGVGDYARTFRVGDMIDPAGISADYDSGVLTLHLPKLAAAQPHRIAVRSN